MSNFDCRYIAACLLAALALVVGPEKAQADPILGIIVTGSTLMPTGDPLAELGFQLSLAPGNAIVHGDNITILNVPDFDGNANYVFKFGNLDLSGLFTITTSADILGGTDIELEFTAPTPPAFLFNPTSHNFSIGELFVETSVNFPVPDNSPLLNPLNYTSQTHSTSGGGLNSGSGITATPSVVPEPASMALIGLGLSSVWLLTHRRAKRSVSPLAS